MYTKQLACANCRRGKLKCDREKPCASCKTRGLQHQCYENIQSASSETSAYNGPTQQGSNNGSTLPLHLASSFHSLEPLEKVTQALQAQEEAFSSVLALMRSNTTHHAESSEWEEQVRYSLPSLPDCHLLLDYCYKQVSGWETSSGIASRFLYC